MNVNDIHDLLGKKLKIEIVDGRIFVGIFLSLDREGNIVLGETVETLPFEMATSKSIGCALINSIHMKKVYTLKENLKSS